MALERISVKFGGASGQGVNSVGKLLAKTLCHSGFHIFAYREYPSLIKGGVASYQIDFSNKRIASSKRNSDLLFCFTPEALFEYLPTVSENGIIIYDSDDFTFSEEQDAYIKGKNITTVLLDTVSLAKKVGGTEIMSNVVMLGFVWKILGLDIDVLVESILDFFKNKDIDFKAEEACIRTGFDSAKYRPEMSKVFKVPKLGFVKQKAFTLSGNGAIALGTIAGGVRAYYAYPMTPATSIFKYLGNTSKETGILVKQAENEITAVQMAMGSMYMGTRALTGTSGGGFDLMIETVTCAGISETPLVIILSQRTGAATGVPTWTGAGDLYTARYGGHGEFPKCIISVSDEKDSFTLIQRALNISEKYQLPVILLTEKQISESLFTLKELPKDLPIERGLYDGELRYEITDSGISHRWRPSKNKRPYLSNSDEHLEDGVSTENSQAVIQMSEKRMRKMDTLKEELPEPELMGNKDSDIIFVGWGSVRNTMIDLINHGEKLAYLHYSYIYPLKTKTLEDLISKEKRLVLVENNQSGQLGHIITQETGFKFEEKLLKFDGRPFFFEDILDFLHE